MLDESFRKFEMDDIGCQMLLSCEAAQLETMEHPIYGNLTPKIHKLLRYVWIFVEKKQYKSNSLLFYNVYLKLKKIEF
jgi:hypothetical protein